MACVAAALQAPSGSNRWALQFVIVTDPERRAAIGAAYRKGYATYKSLDGVYIGSIDKGDAERNDEVTIAAISPVAYAKGTEFKPAMRPDPDEVIHWEHW